MRIAVVTPYYGESVDVLRRCHESVAAQSQLARHVLVADGEPQPAVLGWDADHIVLPRPHGDCGNLARGLGAMAAIGEGCDAIAFLDADNWYQPDHLATLRRLMEETGAAVCSSARSLHAQDGAALMALDPESDGRRHVDTSTLLIHRRAADLLTLWCEMPGAVAAIGDWLFLAAARARGHALAHSPAPTVAYRTRWAYHYGMLGMKHPPNVKEDRLTLGPAMRAWQALAADARDRLLHGRPAATPPSPPR